MKKYITIAMVFITFSIVTTINATTATEQPLKGGWQAVYKVDTDGNNIGGRLETLVNAIDSGSDVKVKFSTDSSNIETSIQCEWIGVQKGLDHTYTDDTVGCINTSLVSLKSISIDFGFTDIPEPVYIMLNTRGSIEHRMSSSSVGSPMKYKSAEWFIRIN